MIEMFQQKKFYVLLILIPFICLLAYLFLNIFNRIPDFTYKHGRAIFFPYPGEIIMLEQKKNPHYVYYESMLKKELRNYMSGVIKKNRSVG